MLETCRANAEIWDITEGLALENSNTPHGRKQRTILRKLRNSVQRYAAEEQMARAGEKYLQDLIKQREEIKRADTRHLETRPRFIIERDCELVQKKREREQRKVNRKRK
jgi:uncharacterized protein YaiL (DUF2058 family)